MNEPWARLPALSLKQMQYFVTLARLRHFTDTAHRLAISQPALSSALRQIETVLGGKLINRSAQSVTLTERGALLLPYAERLLNVAQNSFEDMHAIMRTGGGGRRRIGLVPSVGALLFPALTDWMAAHYPAVAMEFLDNTNDGLVAAVANGSLDIGIGILDSTVPAEIEALVLQEDHFVAVIHRDDPLAAQPHLPWRLLTPRDIALFHKGNSNLLMMAMIESHRLTLRLRYRVDFLETLYGLARARLAVAIVPKLYTHLLNDPALRVIALQQVKTHFPALPLPGLLKQLAVLFDRAENLPPAPLLLTVDQALSAVLSLPETTHHRRALITALVGLHHNLFPHAPHYLTAGEAT